MKVQRGGVFQTVGAAMRKERKLKARLVPGTCRLAVVDRQLHLRKK